MLALEVHVMVVMVVVMPPPMMMVVVVMMVVVGHDHDLRHLVSGEGFLLLREPGVVGL